MIGSSKKSKSLIATLLGLILISSMLLLTAGCAPPAPAAPDESVVQEEPGEPAEPVEVNLRLSWLVKGEYVHLYMAQELGYFEEEGIDVTILEGSPSATPTQLLVSGEDQFAYIAADDVIRSVSVGMPLIMVADFLQKTPQAISALGTTPLSGPEDMAGKSLVDTAGGTLGLIWVAFLENQGLSESDVTLEIVDWSAKNTMFLNGDVELMSSYITNDIPVLEVGEGVELNYFLIADYGFNMLAHGLVASKGYVAQNPDVVAGMVRAVQRGVQYTVEHPLEAAQTMAALFPETLEEAVVIRQVEETLKLYHTDNSEGMPYGWQAVEDWESTVSILWDNGGVESVIAASDYFTNDFVDMSIK